MYKIDVYEHGSHTRVRLHHHPDSVDVECGEDCTEEAVERAYHHKGEQAAQHRTAIADAVRRAVLVSHVSHREFLLRTGEQLTLWDVR